MQCVGTGDQQNQCIPDLQQIAGDAANRLSIDAKTGVVSFDTKDLDLSMNAGSSLVNDLVGSKNTYDFSVGPTIMTDKGPVKIDVLAHHQGNMANLPAFGDQTQIGNPPTGVSDILGLYLNNPNMTRVSNTNLKVAPEWTVAFHEIAEAYEKIDGGNEGATLVNQLVTSSDTYGFALSDTANTAGGPVKLTNDPISNLDNQTDVRYPNGKNPTDLPAKGIADQVTIDPKTAQFKDSQGRSVSLSSLAFHELAEAYAKIDGGKQYVDFQNINVVNGTTLQIGPPQQGAHNEAVQREFKLREQRPNIQNSGRAGDQLIRDPHN